MKKLFLASTVALLALSSSGCKMCAESCDYCGPTEAGGTNSQYCGLARRGSILSGYGGGEVIVEEGAVIEGEVQPQQQLEPPSVPKPPAPQVQPMSGRVTMQSSSTRRTR